MTRENMRAVKSHSNLVPGCYCQSLPFPCPSLSLMIPLLYLKGLSSPLFLKLVQEQKVHPSIVESLDIARPPSDIRTWPVLDLLDIYMGAAAASVLLRMYTDTCIFFSCLSSLHPSPLETIQIKLKPKWVPFLTSVPHPHRTLYKTFVNSLRNNRLLQVTSPGKPSLKDSGS